MIDLTRATPTLRDRLLGKIVMPGPATPCATWVGAYNIDGRKTGRQNRGRRPVIQIGGIGSPVVYVTRLLLVLCGVQREHARQIEACHCCPTGTPPDGVYRCVDLDHLRWGARDENEADKYGN